MDKNFWAAEAPSNIALIKYMGKVSGEAPNVPTNSSLSYTLADLRTRVELEKSDADIWQPLEGSYWRAPAYSLEGPARFLKHLQFLKKEWNISECFKVSSANNFPSDCGLASSASSFAALTLATYKMAADLKALDLTIEEVASLSRQGSGSSCRSFFKPWSEWNKEQVFGIQLPQEKLLHLCIVVNDEKKSVSSSEAHRRVVTSPQFKGRPARAEQRLVDLKDAFVKDDWAQAYEICWDEFEDMHQLFESAEPQFQYRTSKTHEALSEIKRRWKKNGDGPLVTMDAGPNIHLLFRPDQIEFYEAYKNEF